mmetsp:Transcript_23326/g.37967  ORF Transcript_23326/g.37967 Transcript_23326/m.37967 type:complete len:151 (-) Transcript_23326:609-1061(-)
MNARNGEWTTDHPKEHGTRYVGSRAEANQSGQMVHFPEKRMGNKQKQLTSHPPFKFIMICHDSKLTKTRKKLNPNPSKKYALQQDSAYSSHHSSNGFITLFLRSECVLWVVDYSMGPRRDLETYRFAAWLTLSSSSAAPGSPVRLKSSTE